jgi:hypothetical protein
MGNNTLNIFEKWKTVAVLSVVWVLLVVVVFNKFAFEIDEFNTLIRIFIATGQKEIRVFDSQGIPHSYNARFDKSFISPFYVVHYGLIYSDSIKNRSDMKGFHWRRDPSIRYWHVPPAIVNDDYFKYSVDWIVSNIKYINGCAHLIYSFDWPYEKYPRGILKSPWWSGLTDSYAIILLLRAYDVYGDEVYLRAAKPLYDSVLTPISLGGSLSEKHGLPWIEEYVDPLVDAKGMSFVLNGMIYSYYSIKSFEEYFSIKNGASNSLKFSIKNNYESFSLGNWSYYDSLGNASNIKYHRISVAQLGEFMGNDETLKKLYYHWKIGANNPGYYWLISPGWPISKFHFIAMFFLISTSGVTIIIITFRLKIRTRN